MASPINKSNSEVAEQSEELGKSTDFFQLLVDLTDEELRIGTEVAGPVTNPCSTEGW
jgi:hypothetical protein